MANIVICRVTLKQEGASFCDEQGESDVIHSNEELPPILISPLRDSSGFETLICLVC